MFLFGLFDEFGVLFVGSTELGMGGVVWEASPSVRLVDQTISLFP